MCKNNSENIMNKMQPQKIYIDVDEEITTVIDHLQQMKGADIELVVPQHALLLQSVVNLKLLAQEAKKRKKNIILMTRDEDGIAFAMRAGIQVQPYMSEEDELTSEEMVAQARIEEKEVPQYAKKIMDGQVENRIQTDMGSHTFFAAPSPTSNSNMSETKEHKESFNHIVEQDCEIRANEKAVQMDMMPSLHGNQSAKGIGAVASVQRVVQPQNTQASSAVLLEKKQPVNNHQHSVPQQAVVAEESVHVSNQNSDHFAEYEQSLHNARVASAPVQNSQYVQPEQSMQQVDTYTTKTKKSITKKPKKMKKVNHDMSMSKSTRFAVKSFVFGGIVLVLFVILIAVLPKTKIGVEPKEVKIDERMEITAQTDQNVYDADRRLVPARLIERDITYTKSFDATGSGDVEAQKAQGTVTIFNEYNASPQPLVATTRFIAEDGTLFRLVNQAVVPGMDGDEAGKVEALVIADKSGDSGNIGPSRFSVPGFEGSPKKDKFYATSDKSMTGGGEGGNGVTLVTSEDIARAGEEMTNEMSQYITEQLSGLVRPEDEVLTPENIIFDKIRSEANVSEGTMAEQFMYEIVTHVKALTFSEKDVLSVMESNISQNQHQYNTDNVDVILEYEDVSSDFDTAVIKMTVHGLADIVMTVDVDSFKNDIIGKKHDDLLSIMEDGYGDEIEKITLESVIPGFPTFIANRISRFAFMTDIFVR